jgi:hypothetical protein
MNNLIPITIYTGADFTTNYIFTDENNSPIDISGNVVCAEIRRFDESSGFISFGVDYDNASQGSIRLTLTAEETITLNPGRYYYDVLLLETTGNVLKIVNGYAIVKKSVTLPLSSSTIFVSNYPNKFGAIVTGDPIGSLNNITSINVDQISNYGVVRVGLFNNCGNLSDLIAYLNNSSNLNKILNYVKNGGVLWFNTEWFNGSPSRIGCAHEANTNLVLSKLGSNIRMNGDSPIVGNMPRSNHPSVIASQFPSVLYANATALFNYGIEIYGYTGPVFGGGTVTGARTMVYEKIGKGIVVASGDVNTYDNGVYGLKPPNELYTAMRSLVSYLNS